jgi:hypothetical protein
MLYDSSGNMVTWSGNIHSGTYQHVALVVSGTTAIVYLGGNSLGSRSISSITASSENMVMGARELDCSAAYLFGGNFDEMYVYPAALTSSQVSQNMNKQSLSKRHTIGEVADYNVTSPLRLNLDLYKRQLATTPPPNNARAIYRSLKVSMYRQTELIVCPLASPFRCPNNTCVSDSVSCCAVVCEDGSCLSTNSTCSSGSICQSGFAVSLLISSRFS